MPTTGWPTCATRCGSARPSPPPREDHATFVEISPHPLLTHAISDTLESARPRGGVQVAANAEPGQPRDADLPHPARDGSAAVGRHAGQCRRHKRLIDLPPTPWLHSEYWAAPFVGEPAVGQCTPAAGHARRDAVRPRPRVAGRCRNRADALAGRPQGARPAGHAGTGFRRDRAGGRQRSPRLAGAVGDRRRRGRADAAAGRVRPSSRRS